MKKFFLIAILLLFMSAAFAQTNAPWHSIQIVDERGVTVTSITSVSIFAPDSSTDAVIYSDRALNNVMFIPITETSDNTTLIDGVLSWYGPDGYDFSITDGTNVATNANHRTRTASEGTLVFPSYITAISSTTYTDAMSATWGDTPAFVQTIAAGVMTFTPGADNNNFVIGVSGTDKNSDFNVYVGTLLGLDIDAGDPSFKWDGGAVILNHDYNANVGLCTGTSTGLVSIGGSSAGTIALDTAAGITVNADDSIAITVSAGTIGIAATGGDLTVDAVNKSLILRGSEVASNAILIDADAGSIDIDSADNITIDAADDIILDTAGGKINLIADGATTGDILLDAEDTIKFLSTSTAAAAYDVDVTSTGGDMTWDTSDGAMTFTAAGASNGDITLDAENDIILTATGAVTITNTEAVTISGALTVTGDTQLVSVTRIDTPIEIVAAVNAIEITESGTVFILNDGSEFATTLPTVVSSAGVTFRFIVGIDPVGTAFTILTDGLEDTIEGVVMVNGAAVGADGPDDTITFTASAAVVGDWVELTSDGVLWYLSGQAVAASGIVPSKAD